MVKVVRRSRVALIALGSAACLATSAGAFGAGYSVTGHISGGAGGAWDYAIVDVATHRIYLAQAGVTALDLHTQSVTTGLVSAAMSHGLASLGDGTVAMDDSGTKDVTIFDGITGKIVATIPTAKDNPVGGMHALDALVVEPHTGLLVAINGESGLLLLIDVKQARVIGRIPVGGHPEFAAASGSGTLFVNLNHGKKSEIIGVDVASRRIDKHFPLAGCEGATGLAYDASAALLLAACDNGWFRVLDAETGRSLASIPIGQGADAVMWDPVRHRAFVASGDSGTLSVIAVKSPTDIELVQTVNSAIGTRLGAVDTQSGILYLPAAKFGPPKPPIPYPSVIPGSFEFLVVAPP
jgi:DNA-binding beta-propeller fold protein YncE